ncbi:MAG: VWA domain-containing protein [Acidobacteria bacterium]|nr:VWA domain-containing protein [Acidobacteriota bacterium]
MSRITPGIGNWSLRQIKFKLILLLAVVTLIASIPSLPAEGQEQTKQTQQTQQKPKQPQDKVPEPEAETIRILSNLVAVPVSVTDTNGEPVRNLKAEDFRLEEEGVVQQLQTLGEPGKTPIELALLFDVSRSVRNRFDFEREAATRFLREIVKPGDTVSIFAIGTIPRLAVALTQNSESAIKEAASIEPTEDSTAFFDTVVRAARYLDDNGQTGMRRVMVTISDGEDTNSERFRLGDAQRELQRNDIIFYAINPSGPSIRLNKISIKGHDGMIRLATDTGGLTFLPDELKELPKVFSQISAELQAQYLLGYYSTSEVNDGKFRRIEVSVPKQSTLRIRARKGYFAPKE